MNEKWFNYAIALTIVMIFVNAFITMGAAQPNQNGVYSSLLMGNQNDSLTYSTMKTNSEFSLNARTTDTSQSPTEEQGFTPVTRTIDDNPVGFNSFDAAITMTLGVELVMLTLANIFSPVAPIFLGLTAIVFFIKAIAIAWLGSIAIRSIFGRIR